MIFETPRLIVRQPEWADGDVYFILNSDPEVVRFIRPPRTRQESAAPLKGLIANNNTDGNGLGGWLVTLQNHTGVIGSLGLFQLPDSDEVNLGYALLQPYWGKGYASEMAKAAIIYAFNTLQLHRIVATAFPGNIASQKILLKCGFVHIGLTVNEGDELYKYELSKTSD